MSKAKSIELSSFATITINEDGSGSIDSYLFEDRPDDWQGDPLHVAINYVFGLALHHALSGVDVTSPSYEYGFNQTMIELVANFVDE